MSDATRFEPPASAVAAPFWDATRERRLVIQRCAACQRAVWFPRWICPHCGDDRLEWTPDDGHATVYAVSVQYRAAHPGLADRVPYAVALVDLDAGVRMMTNIVTDDPESITVGQRVRPSWEPLSDGRHLLVYEPQA